MRRRNTSKYIFLISLGFLLVYCGCQKKQSEEKLSTKLEPVNSPIIPTFDGTRAYEYLLAQTKFGPRVANTDAHRSCLHYLQTELQNFADTVFLQPFTHIGYDGKTLYFTNVIASFHPQIKPRILLCAHWDSRPWADQDKNPKKQRKPVLGANDGASGVAVLLEISRHLKNNPPPIGIDVVLFDGEDYGKSSDLENFLLGSKYFARNKPPEFNPNFGIVLDMVGDAQLELLQEHNSMNYAPDIVRLVWSIAKEVGVTSFVDSPGEAVYDDHIPLNQIGIRTIDIIDFNYPDQSDRYWHTSEDTPDKCSKESLEGVGNVLMHLIYRSPP